MCPKAPIIIGVGLDNRLNRVLDHGCLFDKRASRNCHPRVSNDVDLPFVPTTFHRPLCPLRSKKSMHDSPSLYIEAARSKERSKHYSQ